MSSTKDWTFGILTTLARAMKKTSIKTRKMNLMKSLKKKEDLVLSFNTMKRQKLSLMFTSAKKILRCFSTKKRRAKAKQYHL